MLAEAGWPISSPLPSDHLQALELLWSVCCERALRELACRYAESVLPIWGAWCVAHPEFSGDRESPQRALATARLYISGCVDEAQLGLAGMRAWAASTAVDSYRLEKHDLSSETLAAEMAAASASTTCKETSSRSASLAADYGEMASDFANGLRPGSLQSTARCRQLALTIIYMLDEVAPAR
jgi:hypothetical protein